MRSERLKPLARLHYPTAYLHGNNLSCAFSFSLFAAAVYQPIATQRDGRTFTEFRTGHFAWRSLPIGKEKSFTSIKKKFGSGALSLLFIQALVSNLLFQSLTLANKCIVTACFSGCANRRLDFNPTDAYRNGVKFHFSPSDQLERSTIATRISRMTRYRGIQGIVVLWCRSLTSWKTF